MGNHQDMKDTKFEIFTLESPVQMEFVRIPAGEFLMGSDPAIDEYGNRGKEQPQHLVYLDEYFIGKYPVTNEQYVVFLEMTGYPIVSGWKSNNPPEGKENHPVIDILWHDAMVFVDWLRRTSGMPVRLPSEAQWEKAARGTDGRIFPWGNDWDHSRVSIENKNAKDTTPVGTFSPHGDSPYHVVDMAGNTFEYCSSAYKKYPYNAEDGREDTTIDNRKVLRSGPTYVEGWWDVLRCAVRHSTATDKIGKRCGFRVAIDEMG